MIDCRKCKGLFVGSEAMGNHGSECNGNPFKSPCQYFACERKIYLQLFESEDFQEGDEIDLPAELTKAVDFLSQDEEAKLQAEIESATEFLHNQEQSHNESNNFSKDSDYILQSDRQEHSDISKSIDFVEDMDVSKNEPIINKENLDLHEIINENINYLKSGKSSEFLPNTNEPRLQSPFDRQLSRHLSFLDDTTLLKSRIHSPFEKSSGFPQYGNEPGFHGSSQTYSSNPSIPFSCNLATDLLSSYASTQEETQQALLSNIDECPTLQYLDLAKKDPFLGQNLGIQAQVNSKDPFLINASVKQLPDQKCPPQLIKSSEDLQEQVSPTFQLQDNNHDNYFNFPSTLDEPTQLDYLDLATLDLLTNPCLPVYGPGYSKDKLPIDREDAFSEDGLVSHEPMDHVFSKSLTGSANTLFFSNDDQLNPFTQGKSTKRRLTKEKKPIKEKIKSVKKTRSSTPKKNKVKSDSKEIIPSTAVKRTRKDSEKSNSDVRKQDKLKQTEKIKMFHQTPVKLARSEKKTTIRKQVPKLCPPDTRLNIKEQLVGYTEHEKATFKAVLAESGTIIVKKQKLKHEKTGTSDSSVATVMNKSSSDIAPSCTTSLGGSCQHDKTDAVLSGSYQTVNTDSSLSNINATSCIDTTSLGNNSKSFHDVSTMPSLGTCTNSISPHIDITDSSLSNSNALDIDITSLSQISGSSCASIDDSSLVGITDTSFIAVTSLNNFRDSSHSDINDTSHISANDACKHNNIEPSCNFDDSCDTGINDTSHIGGSESCDHSNIESSLSNIDDASCIGIIDSSLGNINDGSHTVIKSLSNMSNNASCIGITDSSMVEITASSRIGVTSSSFSNISNTSCSAPSLDNVCDASPVDISICRNIESSLPIISETCNIGIIESQNHGNTESSFSGISSSAASGIEPLSIIGDMSVVGSTESALNNIIDTSSVGFALGGINESCDDYIIGPALSNSDLNSDAITSLSNIAGSDSCPNDTDSPVIEISDTGHISFTSLVNTSDSSQKEIADLASIDGSSIGFNIDSPCDGIISKTLSNIASSSTHIIDSIPRNVSDISGSNANLSSDSTITIQDNISVLCQGSNTNSSLSDIRDSSHSDSTPSRITALGNISDQSLVSIIDSSLANISDQSDNVIESSHSDIASPSIISDLCLGTNTNSSIRNSTDLPHSESHINVTVHGIINNQSVDNISDEIIGPSLVNVSEPSDINEIDSSCGGSTSQVKISDSCAGDNTYLSVGTSELPTSDTVESAISNMGTSSVRYIGSSSKSGLTIITAPAIDNLNISSIKPSSCNTNILPQRNNVCTSIGRETGISSPPQLAFSGTLHKTAELSKNTKATTKAISLITAQGKNSLKCPQCDFMCANVSVLKTHLYTHSRGFLCSQCSDSFSTKNSLKNHESKKHSGDLRYECTKCNYKTPRKQGLKDHMKKHDGNYVYCDVEGCEFKTIYKRVLTKHKGTHAGGRRFYCDKCTICFNDSAALRRHLNQVHMTTDKYFRCSECEYCSALREDVVKHYKVRHLQLKNYHCNQCDFKTGYTNKLRLHIMSHAGIQPYKCSACTYQVNDSFRVERHIRTVHIDRTGVMVVKMDLPFELVSKDFKCRDNDINSADINVIEITKSEMEELKLKYGSKKPAQRKNASSKTATRNASTGDTIQIAGKVMHVLYNQQAPILSRDTSCDIKHVKSTDNCVTLSTNNGGKLTTNKVADPVNLNNCNVAEISNQTNVYISNTNNLISETDSSNSTNTNNCVTVNLSKLSLANTITDSVETDGMLLGTTFDSENMFDTVKIQGPSNTVSDYITAYMCKHCSLMFTSTNDLMTHLFDCEVKS